MSNNVSTIGQLIDNNARLRDIRSQLNELQIQLASGKKTNMFAGLGQSVVDQQRTRADLNQIGVYRNNITVGKTRIDVILRTVSEFKEQAKNFADAMGLERQKGNDLNIAALKEFAHTTNEYIHTLINVKDGDRYLFAGSDAFNQPLDDTGAHDTFMIGLLEDWKAGTIDTDTLISSYKTTPETTIGYSSVLSSAQTRGVFVRADVSRDLEYTLLGNSAGFKDILNAMTLFENLDLDKVSLDEDDNPLVVKTAPGTDPADQRENFYAMFEDVIKTINGGLNKLELEEQRLQRVHLQLGTIEQDHIDDKNALETTLGQIEDIDPTEVAIRINSLQIQLTAAYQVTAKLGQQSLSNFI